MTQKIAYTRTLDQISARDLPLVGGKGANLGEMSRAGFPVPPGFCVTTAAFEAFTASCPQMERFYADLAALPADDLAAVRQLGSRIRHTLARVPMPAEVATAVQDTLNKLDPLAAYAVRSSATAEDLPDASFAGQQDTYLNVQGETAVLDAIRRCWASLFTDRAILYRQQNGFDHQTVALSVVVQQMILPDVSGILFTADPISQNRFITSIDASYGLGEALVAGLVTADLYRVDTRTHTLIEAKVGDKKLAIRPLPDGGTEEITLNEAQRTSQVLTTEQALALARLGQQIESHYSVPQDIEWAMAANKIYLLQTRPITTLFPLPQPEPQDDALHLYVSLSHAQVMTDPIKQMGISIWQLAFPTLKTAGRNSTSQSIKSAGGRMYMDVTHLLNLRIGRRIVPGFLTMAEEMIAAGVKVVIKRPSFRHRLHALKPQPGLQDVLFYVAPIFKKAISFLFRRDPAQKLAELTAEIDHLISVSQQRVMAKDPGLPRLQQIQQELGGVFMRILPDLPALVAAGLLSQRLLIKVMRISANHEDITAVVRGLSGNVTTDMDLAVGDLADLIRQSPQLVNAFQQLPPLEALAQAATISGSGPFLEGWTRFLNRYGMRGPSEIDITRNRWQEDPTSLLQFIVGNLQHSTPGSHRQHHAQLAAAGEAAGARLVTAAGQGPLGFIRQPLVRRLVRAVRYYTPGREHPKFYLIQMLWLIKEVLLETAAMLHAEGRIDQLDDIWYVTFQELIDFVAQPTAEIRPLVSQRRAEFSRFHKLTPPRVITSDGEIVTVRLSREGMPAGALVGSAASSGMIEGIAKVVLDPNTDVLAKGEILVAPFTDPGWTPLFINAAALVMEVGGLMTHGSVVAREYGIPAVVGVPDVTRLIKTGEHIRVHGDRGFVEILETADPVIGEVTI